MTRETFLIRKAKALFDSKADELKTLFQDAKDKGLLYLSSFQTMDNTTCSRCGCSESKKIVVSICKDKQTLENDPMGGEVYLFGQTCWNKFGFKG